MRKPNRALNEYLRSRSITRSAFADLIGVTPGAVSQWCVGHSEITAERALEIEKATNAELTRYALRPDLFGAQGA